MSSHHTVLRHDHSKTYKVIGTETPLWVKIVSAGAGACIAEIFTIQFDTAKVRLQVQSMQDGPMKYKGVFSTLRTMAKEEGLKGLYRGLTPALHRQLGFSTIKLGCYDSTKHFYTDLLYHDKEMLAHVPVSIRILAGVTTGVLAVGFAQPTEVVKVRMQAQFGANKGRYSGTMQAYRHIFTTEGIKGLWRGCVPNMTRNGIINISEVVTYDIFNEWIIRNRLLEDGMPCHLVSAIAAGFCATVVSSPVDVVKTRYMNSVKSQYNNILHCIMSLWKKHGFFGFYKGFYPALVRLGTWNTFTFLSYEKIKLLLHPNPLSYTLIPAQNVNKATGHLDRKHR